MDRTITLAGNEYELRYNIRARHEAEKELGKGLIDALVDGQIKSIATILWAGMRHKQRKLTVDDVMELLQKHAEAGGEYDDAGKMAVVALVESKVLGKVVNPRLVERYLAELNEETEGKVKAPTPPA